jgi:hypothetical protein
MATWIMVGVLIVLVAVLARWADQAAHYPRETAWAMTCCLATFAVAGGSFLMGFRHRG